MFANEAGELWHGLFMYLKQVRDSSAPFGLPLNLHSESPHSGQGGTGERESHPGFVPPRSREQARLEGNP